MFHYVYVFFTFYHEFLYINICCTLYIFCMISCFYTLYILSETYNFVTSIKLLSFYGWINLSKYISDFLLLWVDWFSLIWWRGNRQDDTKLLPWNEPVLEPMLFNRNYEGLTWTIIDKSTFLNWRCAIPVHERRYSILKTRRIFPTTNPLVRSSVLIFSL